jgi:Mor family transcriptional regulator
MSELDEEEKEYSISNAGVVMVEEIEEWVILVEFKLGATMRGLAKRYKKKVPEIEDIIRRKWDELSAYKPLARRRDEI